MLRPNLTNQTLQRIINKIYVASLIAIVAGLLFISAFLIYEANRDPVVYQSIEIKTPTLITGQPLTYEFKYCRYAGPDVVGNITRSFIPVELVNGHWEPVVGKAPVLLFESVRAAGKPGCNTSETTATIPNMPSGNYQLRYLGSYDILSILPPSVDEVSSKTVYVNQSEADAQAVKESLSTTTTVIDSNGNQQTSTTTTPSINNRPMSSRNTSNSADSTTTNTTTTTTNNSTPTTTTSSNNQTEEPPRQSVIDRILNPVEDLLGL